MRLAKNSRLWRHGRKIRNYVRDQGGFSIQEFTEEPFNR
jgi:hypothetical protein